MLWRYSIILAFLALAVAKGSGQEFVEKDLYKYEDEQSEGEAFRRINRWMIKKVLPTSTLDESLDQLSGLVRKSKMSMSKYKFRSISYLLSSQPFDPVAKFVLQAIRQLKAATQIDDTNRCNDNSNRLLARIYRGLFLQQQHHKDLLEEEKEENRLQTLAGPIFWLHAQQCHEIYQQKFAELEPKIPSEVKESVDKYLQPLVDLRFENNRIDKDEVAVTLLETLRKSLPEGESMFKDRTFLVQYHEKREQNLDRLKELLERFLKCRQYYQALNEQVFEPASMDRFFHDPISSKESEGKFYEAWSKVRICKWIAENPDKMASNMLFWASFVPGQADLYYW